MRTAPTDDGHLQTHHLAAARYSPRPLTQGEEWTARELLLLRRRSYRPRAWASFLLSAYERSGDTRSARPAIAGQARVWGVAGAGAWIGACLMSSSSRHLRLRPISGLLWWGAVWQMLDWHLGMAEGGDGVARERLAPADAVTMARFWLVPAVLGCRRSRRALTLVIVAGGASDWLDGKLALDRGRTRLGRDLDTMADLAFFTAGAIASRRPGGLTTVGFAAIAARQSTGVLLASTAVFARARRPAIRARRWGAALRATGLAVGAAGAPRTSTALLLAGCCVPPRPTAPSVSPA